MAFFLDHQEERERRESSDESEGEKVEGLVAAMIDGQEEGRDRVGRDCLELVTGKDERGIEKSFPSGG